MNVPLTLSRPGKLRVQLFVKARRRGAKLIPYGERTVRVKTAGHVLVRVKPSAGLPRRYRTNARKWIYSGRATLTAGKQRFALRFAVQVIKSK